MINADGLKKLFKIWSDIMSENKDMLIDLDSIVGDGDLGLTMSDGFKAACEAIKDDSSKDIGMLTYRAGKAMSTAVPSTMGTLMASGLMASGKALKGEENMDLAGLHKFCKAYFDGVQNRGKAKTGEKTFLDGMIATVNSLEIDAAEGAEFKAACARQYDETVKAYKATAGMLAVHGRAATRGEASRELLDPGAAVAVLLSEGLKIFSEAQL